MTKIDFIPTYPQDYTWFIDKIDALTDEKLTTTPVSWAEQKRYLPPGTTPQPGGWSKQVAPYTTEILDRLGPNDPIQEVVIAKGAQTCLTVSVAENFIGYTIDVDPCSMMYATADAKMVRERMELAIDLMIDGSGLREKIFSQSERKAPGKQGGDTQTKKEFPGGFLLGSSLQSSLQGRSFSIRRLILDEIDSAKNELGRDGDPLSIYKARTSAYETTRKILYISTPLEKSTSKIWPLYKLGDRRRYFIPCLACGTMQTLEWDQIKYQAEKNYLIPESVYYECNNCQHHLKNHDKVEILARGEWRPTAKAKRVNLTSYHVSALYSPVGMKSWESIVQEWMEAQTARSHNDMSKLRTCINLNFGEPWEERGESPKHELIMGRRTDYSYQAGSVPEEGPIFLTSGTDVQGDRLETEVVGWGPMGQSWSHSYEVIKGDVNDPDTWHKLESFLSSSFLSAGKDSVPLICSMVDCGYKTKTVYNFCSQLNGVYPVMGQPGPNLKKWKAPFKAAKLIGHDTHRIDLDVNYLKDEIYNSLKRGPDENDIYPPGFCFFPIDYPQRFFRMLTAEERILETNRYGHSQYRWVKTRGRTNEALDCRVYALAGLYIVAYNACIDTLKLESIQWDIFWDYAKKQLTKSV